MATTDAGTVTSGAWLFRLHSSRSRTTTKRITPKTVTKIRPMNRATSTKVTPKPPRSSICDPTPPPNELLDPDKAELSHSQPAGQSGRRPESAAGGLPSSTGRIDQYVRVV